MINRNELEDELAELEACHRKLDEQISQGYTSYLDDVFLGKMKQEKLVLKRQIEKIKQRLNHHEA